MFEAVLMRENRTKGFFVAFDFSGDALREIDALFRRDTASSFPLTVSEILNDTHRPKTGVSGQCRDANWK